MSLKDEVILETERLLLRRVFGETHGSQINDVVCDTFESLEPWMIWCKEKPTKEETISGLRLLTDDMRNFLFAIYPKNSEEIIGLCHLKVCGQDEEKTYVVGYWLHKKCCRAGYTTESLKSLILFGSQELGCKKFVLLLNEGNVGSRRVAEKAGFSYVDSEETVYKQRPDWGTRLTHKYNLNVCP